MVFKESFEAYETKIINFNSEYQMVFLHDTDKYKVEKPKRGKIVIKKEVKKITYTEI